MTRALHMQTLYVSGMSGAGSIEQLSLRSMFELF